jgi:hypothetical protein
MMRPSRWGRPWSSSPAGSTTRTNPESYTARPEALRTLNDLRTAWDETLLLGGQSPDCRPVSRWGEFSPLSTKGRPLHILRALR